MCHSCEGSESTGEYLVRKWLVGNSIEYRDQIKINGVKSRNSDYVIIDFILLYSNRRIWIEYNGEQHYMNKIFFHKTSEDFNNQLRRDQNVRDYCKENNILLVEIPYTYNTYEKVKDLLDRIILCGEDINTIINYQSLYKI